DDADYVVTAFGTTAKFVRHVVREMRAEGRKIGYLRPITLWPFPAQAYIDCARSAREIGVFELNGGERIEDVGLPVLGRAPARACGAGRGAGDGVGRLFVGRVRLGRRAAAQYRDHPDDPGGSLHAGDGRKAMTLIDTAIIDTNRPPDAPAKQWRARKPSLLID